MTEPGPRAELHPRPQLRRERWADLCGRWASHSTMPTAVSPNAGSSAPSRSPARSSCLTHRRAVCPACTRPASIQLCGIVARSASRRLGPTGPPRLAFRCGGLSRQRMGQRPHGGRARWRSNTVLGRHCTSPRSRRKPSHHRACPGRATRPAAAPVKQYWEETPGYIWYHRTTGIGSQSGSSPCRRSLSPNCAGRRMWTVSGCGADPSAQSGVSRGLADTREAHRGPAGRVCLSTTPA